MKETNANSMELLELLSAKSGCTYLSDLKNPKMLPYIQTALLEIRPTLFGILEWTDAVKYITGEPGRFQTSGSAKKYLLDFTLKTSK